ncbi:MAG: helix-turn-helix domain-containing protein [Gammaproteobacteria bacterium]
MYVADLSSSFRLLALSQALLLALGLLAASRGRGLAGAPWLIALGLGLSAYFALPVLPSGVPGAVTVSLLLLSSAIPLTLWGSVRAVFEDDRRPDRRLLAIGAGYLVMVVYLLLDAPTGGLRREIDIAIQLAKIGFAVAAAWVCLRGRDADLVESRRAARHWVAAGIALLIIVVVVTELVTNWRIPPTLETFAMGLFFVVLMGLNVILVRRPLLDSLGPQSSVRAVASGDLGAEDPLVAHLETLMGDERVYTDPDLRIATLAERLGVSEHTLRRTINGTLGHRNFNRYVNGFRVRDAGRRLLADQRTPVLTIALDVGFRSLSSFNAAFRDHYGMSPTGYRASPPPESEKI